MNIVRAPANVVKAAKTGNVGVLREWLDSGGQVNAARFDGKTSLLHIAAGNGHERVVDLLLWCGAEMEQQDSQGHHIFEVPLTNASRGSDAQPVELGAHTGEVGS